MDINIVFASDDNYAQHTAVAMASILLNTKKASDIKFFLIDDNISENSKRKIIGTVTSYGGEITFVNVNNEKLKACYVSGEISRTCYFRLDIPNILDSSIDKVIYLDCDLLVYDDIAALWSMDIQNKPVGAVEDYGIMASKRIRKQKAQYIGLPFGKPYFNSGVLVMDLKKWRDGNYSEKIIRIAQENKFPNHDQDALNKFFMDNWYALPLRWNVIPPVFNLFMKILLKKEMRAAAIPAKLNPAIFHYAGGYKPWEYESYSGFNDKYYEYLGKTEFRDADMPQFDKRRKNRSIKRQLLRLKIGDFWAKIFK